MIRKAKDLVRFLSPRECIAYGFGRLLQYDPWNILEATTEKVHQIDLLSSGGWEIEFLNDEFFGVHLAGKNIRLEGRTRGSDALVYRQIFLNGEYDPVLRLFEDRFKGRPQVIVDAGCNIGCTTLYFLSEIPSAKVIAVEPSIENIDLARANIVRNGFGNNVKLLCRALWPVDAKLAISDKFRDGLQWAFTVEEASTGEIEAITPEQVIAISGVDDIDLFKIDIEGAESMLFRDEANIGWLSKVKLLAIEVHQERIKEDAVGRILRGSGFDVMCHGELTIGVNRNYVEKYSSL